MKRFGPPKCGVCDKAVYPNELVNFQDNSYHKKCFKCSTCQKQLYDYNSRLLDGKLLCSAHFNIAKGNMKAHQLPAANSPAAACSGPSFCSPIIAKRMFNKFDEDKDGHISREEFHRLLESLGYFLSPEEMEWAMKIVDKDASGTIELNEFLDFYKNERRFDLLKLNEDVIEKYQSAFESFNSFDDNHNGVLELDEFKEYINSLNGLFQSDPEEIFYCILPLSCFTLLFSSY